MTEIYALDLDEEVLSHLVIPESVEMMRYEDISKDLIEDDIVRIAFDWQMSHKREYGVIATPSVFADEFDLDLVDPETAIGDLIERLRARWIRNQGRRALEKLGTQFRDDPAQIPSNLTSLAREFNEKTAKRGDLFGTGDIERALKKYDKKVLRGIGPSFGFPMIDDHFYGMLGLSLIIAPPKTYKSWIMIKSLAENVRNGKYPWLYSLELPAEETDMRIRCMLADIPYWRYLRNSLTNDDRRKLIEASEEIDAVGSYKVIKPPQGERGIDRMVDNAREGGADLILIDQLQYVENRDGHSLGEKNETGSYWQVLDKARNLSDDGPITFAHQFNRNAMFAEEMPPVEYAKGSSAIEETSTLALGIWGNKDMRRSNVLEIGTLVSRNYMFKSWELGIELSQGCNFELLGEVEDD